MATPQLSPGVLIREVDLTVGRADNVLDNIGAIAGPFAIGPVDQPIDITTERELINTFGKPLSTDGQYEYWMSASSFLSYGGVLKVVRTSGSNLNNANSDRSGVSTSSLRIKNYDDYTANFSADSVSWGFAAKNPGTWANSLKVCLIDDRADQILTGVTTANITVGTGVTTGIATTTVAGVGTTSTFSGYLKGIVTGIGVSTVDVKIVSRVSSGGTETQIEYSQRSQLNSFRPGNTINFINSAGVSTGTATTLSSLDSSVLDWYDEQTLGLTNTTVYWKSIAPKPKTNNYSLQRNGKNDGVHVVVVDDTGTITGIQGNLLESHLSLSKASDAISAENSPQRIFWKDYLALNSAYVYAGDNPSNDGSPLVAPSGFTTYSGISSASFTGISTASGLWNLPAQGVTFSSIGNVSYTLTGGKDYGTSGGSMTAELGDLATSYNLFLNENEIQVDYLIMGPGLGSKELTQSKAASLISIANQRKDCLAVISPHRGAVLTGTVAESPITNTDTQTNNIIEFFSSLPSTSYAVFDSGYKYTYDRFNNKFRYIPCNPDVAGLMVRTNINSYPWFSPAGQQRGILNSAIKLAYNPNKSQRDRLYPQRVNAIINQPGIGVLLYGDKTALGYASAFDRINVRRLFLTVEQALRRTADAQLFELNDELTRANFVNIVEPYLRDVQAKRGLYGFLVVCDASNNTPDIIDNNEFRADIYLKPTKSINYVTLTFVATRTGVSFEEVAGTV